MNLTILNVNAKVVTMSSREIAELTGKHHFHVTADIAKMLSELGEDATAFRDIYVDSMNRTQIGFTLDRELTETLLTGYSAKLRRIVIARWHELEAKQAFTLPDFTNPASAARAWAIQYEASQTLTIERDHAIATKAQIGDKKVATAMATASKHSRENKKLKCLIGEAAENASIIAVQNKTGVKTYKWRDLKNYSAAMGLSMGKSYNPGLQMNVNTYPAETWFEVYGVDLVELFGGVAA